MGRPFVIALAVVIFALAAAPVGAEYEGYYEGREIGSPPVGSSMDCQLECTQNAQCRAWTFWPRPWMGSTHKCFLFSNISKFHEQDGPVSGEVRQ
jgi:hypothetical protein